VRTFPPLKNGLRDVLEANVRWAEEVGQAEPGLFEAIAKKPQEPKICWIGWLVLVSDS
jgi:carbonic anhydrase